MNLTDVLAILGAALVVLVTAPLALRRTAARPVPWWWPAGVAAGFGALSVAAVVDGGPLGFWAEHTRKLWGNQIWFDLLIAVSVAWVLLLPRLRAARMTPWPWLLLILATGCVGLATTVARLRYLEQRRAATTA